MEKVRSFAIPSGFKSQNISSYNYTNSDIDYMFNFFSCCYADMANAFSTNAKRGSYNDREKAEHRKKMAFMSTGIKMLSTWRNINALSSDALANFIFNKPVPLAGNTCGASIYLNPSPLPPADVSKLPLLATVSGQANWTLVEASLQTQLSLKDFSISSIVIDPTHDNVTISAPNPYGSFNQYVYIVSAITGSSPFSENYNVQFAGGKDVYTPCVTLATVQKFVQKMQNICGCFGCKSTGQIVADNNYVSVGQVFNKSTPPVALPMSLPINV